MLTLHSSTSIISIAYLPLGVQQHRNHIEILIYRPTLVSDNDSNKVRAMKDASLLDLGCFAHTLQLVVHNGVLSQRAMIDTILLSNSTLYMLQSISEQKFNGSCSVFFRVWDCTAIITPAWCCQYDHSCIKSNWRDHKINFCKSSSSILKTSTSPTASLSEHHCASPLSSLTSLWTELLQSSSLLVLNLMKYWQSVLFLTQGSRISALDNQVQLKRWNLS